MKAGSSRGPRSIGAGLWFLLLWASAAEAAGQPRYALVIGNNRPPLARADLPSLRYADDDAVRYQELFLRLGAQTHLLTVPDADTQRRHPEVAGRALPPSLEVLRRAVDQVARAADAAPPGVRSRRASVPLRRPHPHPVGDRGSRGDSADLGPPEVDGGAGAAFASARATGGGGPLRKRVDRLRSCYPPQPVQR